MSNPTPNEVHIAELKKKTERINRVSPSFCLAKWLQSTIYLHNGMTHSCHHPSPHRIPLEEIANSPEALHNTKFKQKTRRQMLKGERPTECQYCWNIEDLGADHISDRAYKSTAPWAFKHLEEIVKNGADAALPTYLEVAFDSTCNFKCAYCSPDLSTKWMEEIRSHGPYPTSWNTGDLEWLKKSGRFPLKKQDDNPYVEAFWKWWPELYPQLHTFRITGGEPLLSQNTWRILDYIEEHPHGELNLAINTNLGAPDELIDKLIDRYNRLHGKINSFEIYTSCEAFGEQAEYIRFGLNYSRFIGNIEKFFQNTEAASRINLMITFNVLSVTSFARFLENVWTLRHRYNQTNAMNRLPMMINYLRWPPFMSMKILTDELKTKYSDEYLTAVHRGSRKNNPDSAGRFYLEEIDQVERLCKYLLSPANPQETLRDRKDFALFFQEYDRRRQLNFQETFPELSGFYEECLTMVKR